MQQRMVLNQADLKTRDVEGTAIIVFKRKRAKDPLLKQYLVWMQGIIDAMDKNYVSNVRLFLFLLFFHHDDIKTIGVYSFFFSLCLAN